MRLSAHFTSEEFDCHDGTVCPRSAHRQLRKLCRVYLEPLRARWGPVTIVSGYRTRAYNRSVGGVPASTHIYRGRRAAVGCDLVCQHGTPADWADSLDELGIGGLGRYDGHVHADTRVGRFRW